MFSENLTRDNRHDCIAKHVDFCSLQSVSNMNPILALDYQALVELLFARVAPAILDIETLILQSNCHHLVSQSDKEPLIQLSRQSPVRESGIKLP